MMRASASEILRPAAMRHSTATASISIVLALGLPLASPGAPATDPARTGSFGKGKTNRPLLTRGELRDCLATQERIRELTESITTTQAALNKEKAEIAQGGVTLGEQLAALDRTSADAVNAYNASAQAHDRRIDAYNAQTPAFNAKVDALKGARTRFTGSCENRDFDEKDETAIRKGQ